MNTDSTSTYRARDRALIVLAGVITVVALVCSTILAAQDRIPAEAAVVVLTAAISGISGMAIGRMSGASGERP